MLSMHFRCDQLFLIYSLVSIWFGNVDGTSVDKSLKACQTEIIVSVFGAIGFCAIMTVIVLMVCWFSKRKRRQRHEKHAQSHKLTDIEGRRNKVFEDENKDDDEYTGGRKRQDSGFVASSNESIVPLPELLYSSSGPRRSPSMPNLRYGSDQQQNLNEEVFKVDDSQAQVSSPRKPEMISIGVSTEDLGCNSKIQHDNSKSDDISPSEKRNIESVTIEKKSFNCTGIDFGIGGVYVKDFDPKEISFKKGILSVGDEVLSINDYPLNGLTDMEAFSFFAKSGPVVKLKVSKGVYIDKAEGMSVCSADFQMSESSSDEEENYPSLSMSYNDLQNTTTSSISIHRLPRVIADANNLSMDGIDNERILNEQKYPESLLLKTTNNHHANQSDPCSPLRTLEIEHDVNRHAQSLGNTPCHRPQNGSNSNQELQELAKLHLAYPALFMEFMKSLDKEKTYRKQSRGSDNSECCLHSRNASSERNRQHSRHCSNDHCCHTTYICPDLTNRHHRNCSCGGSSRHSGSNFTEDKTHSISPMKGMPGLFRTISGENNAPIFTVDSYTRLPVDQINGTSVIDASQQIQKEQKQENHQQQQQIDLHTLQHTQQTSQQQQQQQQKTEIDQQQILYYQQLSQQQQIEQSQQILPNELNNSQNKHSQPPQENLVVQRGYNNDYIVPVNTNNFPSVTTVYAKTMHRNKDSCSPIRRTSPVYTGQTVPRFPSSNTPNPIATTTSPVDYRSTAAPLSSSPQSSICSTSLPRKPPPDYASIQRTSSDASGDGSGGREFIEMDAEIIRKMTQKYSEPRFRKHPPPYRKAISTMTRSESNLASLGSDGVVLRNKSSDRGSRGTRSRPHSYTESGALISDANHVQPKVNTSLDESNKRNQPKRTHSMPAVKHLEMRPLAAQVFLADNIISNDSTQQPIQPQQLVVQPPYQQLSQQQATLTTQMSDPPTYDQVSQPVQQTIPQSYPLEQQQTQQQNHQVNEATNHVQNYKKTTPKKLKSRQQRAEESFNRRKSIDSGTLRKLAEEMYENPALGGEFPILSQLLGETQFGASERRAQGLYRHKSTEALYSQF